MRVKRKEARRGVLRRGTLIRALTIMTTLSGAGKIVAYEKVRRFCELRLQGHLPENEIAKKLGFGSPEAMHMQLKNWGLSGPLVETDRTGDTSERQRKAHDSGESKKLPAAEQAERLFRADLKRLTYYLDEILDLKEHLQGKLFVSSSWVGEDWEEYHREEYTENDWKRVCQDFDVDPAQEAFRVPISPYVHRGAGPLPWEGLTVLIAVHALLREDLDRLIGALHHDPASVNLEELYERRGKDGGKKDGLVTTLKKSAAQLAETVRGSEVSRGQKHGKALRLEVQIAMAVQELKREGYSAEEIYRRLKERRLVDEEGKVWVEPEHGPVHKEKYTLDDVERHMKLGLLPPD